MRRLGWMAQLSLVLVGASLVMFLIHYVIFRDAYFIFYYPLLDIAFMPINVLLVTVVLNRALTSRERRAMLKKMNMVIGAFFSEVGTELVRRFVAVDAHADELREHMIVGNKWTDADFGQALRSLAGSARQVDAQPGDLAELQGFLTARRNFLLRLLENPNLLEHEQFTELLWAVFHLSEELSCRENVARLPETDRAHLNGDITRAYGLLLREWLGYVRHLRTDYPYLYSLAVRTNPFDQHADPQVQ